MDEARPDVTPADPGHVPEDAQAICDKCGTAYSQHANGEGVRGPLEQVRGLACAMGGWTEHNGSLFCIGCAPGAIAEQMEAEADAKPSGNAPEETGDIAYKFNFGERKKVHVVISEKALCGVFATLEEANNLAELVGGMTNQCVLIYSWSVGTFGFRRLPLEAKERPHIQAAVDGMAIEVRRNTKADLLDAAETMSDSDRERVVADK